MVARSTKRSNRRPDTLMQDRQPPDRRNFLRHTAGPYMRHTAGPYIGVKFNRAGVGFGPAASPSIPEIGQRRANYAKRHKRSCCLARSLAIRDRRRSLNRAIGAARGHQLFRGSQIGIFLTVHASPDTPFCERPPHARRREWRCEVRFRHLYRRRKTHRV